jgi:hypothetical protein
MTKEINRWTKEEDEKLRQLHKSAIGRGGHVSWKQIAEFIPGKTAQGCRIRFERQLNVENKVVGRWSKEEDEVLMKGYQQLCETEGINWVKLAKMVPGRTDSQCHKRVHYIKYGGMKQKEEDFKTPVKKRERAMMVDLEGEKERKKKQKEMEKELRKWGITGDNDSIPTVDCESLMSEFDH